MAINWNLDNLYSAFDSKKFLTDWETCEELAMQFNETIETLLKQPSQIEILEGYLRHVSMIKLKFSSVASFSSLSFSANSNDTLALKYLQNLQRLQSFMVVGHVRFEKWLLSVENITALTLQSNYLKEHSFFINQIIEKSKYTLDENVEEIIAKMRTTGSQSWNTLQTKTSSSTTADVIDDEVTTSLPLQAVRDFAYDRDPLKRKKGYDAELLAYKQSEDISAAALNGIKGESITLSKLRGFESPLEQTLVKSKMNKETLDAMLEAMRDSMPKFRLYLKRKAEILGYEKGLPFYDLMAPLGKSDISFPYDEGKKLVLEQFKSFSQELYEFALKAFEEDWIDVEPRMGKTGGAFCASVLSLKESRILLNYTGNLNNAITLAHELGHAFHNKNLFDQEILNIGSPMPLAETASIFCETIVKNAALQNAEPSAAFGILEVALQGYSQVIIDIYSRFIFESRFFEERVHGDLSTDEIKRLMLEAQEVTYGDGLDPDIRHPYMWMNKGHYYIPDMDFYNFPYAFGLLFAKGLYGQYVEMGESFAPKLNHLLSSTGKMSVVDVAKLLNVDVTDKKFWASSLKVIEDEIDHFMKLSYKIYE